MAAQLTDTKGSVLRDDSRWRPWARISLPVPLSPVMSTVESLRAKMRSLASMSSEIWLAWT